MATGKFNVGETAFLLRVYCHQWYMFSEELLPAWDQSVVEFSQAPLWAIPVDPTKLRINVGELLR
jgi:hypothetical protein